MPIPDSPMSCRAYAKRRGVTPMAVSLAIKNGRLVACVVRDQYGNPKISDPELADREWEANTDLSKAPTFVKERAAARAAETDATPAPAPAVETGGDVPEESISSATAREKHWRAKLAELKFKEAAGQLVPSADVERRLVDVFSACKTRLLAIPSRARQALPHLVAADVASLEALIREALEDLAEPGR